MKQRVGKMSSLPVKKPMKYFAGKVPLMLLSWPFDD
jgi:hypothetical protein